MICGDHCSDEYENLAKYNFCPNVEEVCGQSWFILGDEPNDHEHIRVDFDDLDQICVYKIIFFGKEGSGDNTTHLSLDIE